MDQTLLPHGSFLCSLLSSSCLRPTPRRFRLTSTPYAILDYFRANIRSPGLLDPTAWEPKAGPRTDNVPSLLQPSKKRFFLIGRDTAGGYHRSHRADLGLFSDEHCLVLGRVMGRTELSVPQADICPKIALPANSAARSMRERLELFPTHTILS